MDTVTPSKQLSRLLSSLNGVGPAVIRKETVHGVPGAFVLKEVLSHSECESIEIAVQNFVQHHESKLSNNGGGEAVVEKRRNSQHHSPLKVLPSDLRPLTSRIVQHLPLHAGPSNASPLEDDDLALSPLLRCYDYRENDYSAPHYDRSFSEHKNSGLSGDGGETRGGALVRFTAYSILFYLNDGFEGGNTNFFPDCPDRARSCRGNTPVAALSAGHDLTAGVKGDRSDIISVVPCRGDCLVFPHGRQKGCHPDPLHEGGVIIKGRKTIIRSDIVYKAYEKKK